MPYRIGEPAKLWQRQGPIITPTVATITTPVPTTVTPTSDSTPIVTTTAVTTTTSTVITTTTIPTTTTTPATTSTTPTSTSLSQSQIVSTVVVTQSGRLVTTVTSTPTKVPVPVAANTKSSSSNIGPIVGGVVGGITVLAFLLIGFCLIRKRSKRTTLEGDIFDPDRTAKRPGRMSGADVDLAEPQMLAHPYHMGEAVGAGAAGVGAAAATRQSGHFQGPEPGQVFDHGQYGYGQSPYPAVASASSHGHGRSMSGGPASMSMVGGRPASTVMSPTGTQSPYAQTTYEPSSVAGNYPSAMSPTNTSGVGAAFLSGGSASSPAQTAPTSKASHMHLTNEDEGPVMQHRDGGRVPESHGSPAPQEVPPAYDSIPQEGPSSGSRAVEEVARPEKGARPMSS